MTASADKTARVWDVRSGVLVQTLRGHSTPVLVAAFSPDGQQVLTGTQSGSVRLWSVSSGETLLRLEGHTGQITAAQFSPDGRVLLTASSDGTARLWNARTGEALTNPSRHRKQVLCARFSPDGRMFVTASSAGLVAMWDVPPAHMPVPDWFPELAEKVAGLRFTARGNIELVRDADFSDVVARLRETPTTNSYTRLGQWFVTDPGQQAASPFGTTAR